MALSILKIGAFPTHGLFDSRTRSFIITGSYTEVCDWKDSIEEAERQASNSEYLENLKGERLELLILSGQSDEEAESFLKSAMPFLFKNKTLLQ